MENKIVILVFLSMFAVSAAAQDLDPTVEVSREYEGKLVEVHKPNLRMDVPDSLMHFALDFDYSVFANPYKGSYEFSPYLLSMKPSESDNGESRFYLRAGAGYQLYPTLDLVWSPEFKSRGFNMDVYANHHSFVGNYHTILPQSIESGVVYMTQSPRANGGADRWFGYDILSQAGAVFKHDWEKVALGYAAEYYGLAQKDRSWVRAYNAVDASLNLLSKPEDVENLVFDLKLDYRLGQDVVGGSRLLENVGALDVKIGPFLKGNHRMSLDFAADIASYSEAFDDFGGSISLVPHYVFRKDRFSVELGLRVSKMLARYDLKEQFVYPDINVSYALAPKFMKVYFKASGGGEYETYSSLIASNHHITHVLSSDILGYDVERIGLIMGFDGRITDKFSYNLRGGYANYSSLRHYEVAVVSDPTFAISYLAVQKWFAAIDWLLDIDGFRFDGTVAYDHYWDKYNLYDGSGLGRNAVLKPAALTGNAAVEYNWKKRVACGVDCDFSTASVGHAAYNESVDTDCVPVRNVRIPGYADLGLYAEYATARSLSLWLRAGNLLNQTIQRTPLYAEKGVNVTIGVCVNL